LYPREAEPSAKIMKRLREKKQPEDVLYQCNRCHFILKQKRTDPPPSYCPNCAINHLKGTMTPVGDRHESAPGPHA
ncbi:MAG: hypothetical protein V1758_03305, partial [Pseudomonadota bacterium]